MATTVTHVVDPNGGAGHDYDSLSLWEAGEQGDLTGVRDEIAVAKCRCTGGTADTTAVTIDGWTTSATQYPKIWTDPAEGYRHTGKWTTGNAYRLSVTASGSGVYQAVYVVESHTRLIGLQVESHNPDASTYRIVEIGGTSSIYGYMHECIVRPSNTTYARRGVLLSSYSGCAYLSNCAIYGMDQGFSSAFEMTGDGTQYAYVYNCTLQASVYGAYFSANAYGKNCYASGTTAYASGTLTTCASSDATGTAGLQDILFSTTADSTHAGFTNVTAGSEDFHIKVGSPLIGAATNLYNDATYPFQTDIDGQDRGGAAAAWDIGADEYVSSNPTMTISETLSFAETLD